jgi:hypothetical protein
MPETYVKGNEEAQRLLVNALVLTVRNREFSQMAVILEMLAKSFDDAVIIDKIMLVRKRTLAESGIEFGTFEQLYKASFNVDPRRRIILRRGETVERVPFPVVRTRFENNVIRPLSDIAVELVGRISRDKSVALGAMIAGVASSSLDTVDEIKSRKVKVVY